MSKATVKKNHMKPFIFFILKMLILFSICYQAAYAKETSAFQPTACTQIILESKLFIGGHRNHKNIKPGHVLFEKKSNCLVHINLSPQSNHNVSLVFPKTSLLVKDIRPFYGLATFYNSTHKVKINKSEMTHNQPSSNHSTTRFGDWEGLKGHFNILMFSAPGAKKEFINDSLKLTWPKNIPAQFSVYFGEPKKIDLFNHQHLDFSSLHYSHLWGWLKDLCHLIAWSLTQLQLILAGNWGFAIIALAILVKLLLMPVNLLTIKLQRQVSHYQSLLAPQLAEIKSQFKGEAAHHRIMAAHKKLGISPFYTLKPMIGSLIQVPILVAIFNTLGEMPELNHASLFWIKNLAYPDTVLSFSYAIPLFGNSLNFLPLLMTIVTLVSTILFQNSKAPGTEVSRQKRNLYLMALGFFILFYPFPAAMVLYWTMANLLQFAQQQLIKI